MSPRIVFADSAMDVLTRFSVTPSSSLGAGVDLCRAAEEISWPVPPETTERVAAGSLVRESKGRPCARGPAGLAVVGSPNERCPSPFVDDRAVLDRLAAGSGEHHGESKRRQHRSGLETRRPWATSPPQLIALFAGKTGVPSERHANRMDKDALRTSGPLVRARSLPHRFARSSNRQ